MQLEPGQRLFIAGAISLGGQLDYTARLENAKKILEVTNRFEAQGFETRNGLRPPLGRTWEDCMRYAIKQLMDCDVLVLLPGWEESDGARIERRLARDLGIWIWEMKDHDKRT